MGVAYMNEEHKHLVKVTEVSSGFHIEAKLLLKVTTKADLRGANK